MSQMKNDVNLSKSLSWVLRHAAYKEGFEISEDGFINIQDILKHKRFCNKYTIEDIKRVVEFNDKQRFTLRYLQGTLQICANQGHSLRLLKGVNLTPVSSNEPIEVIHGTYLKNWENIKKQGISRMKRNHIHFSTGLPGDKSVLSGIRRDTEVFIYIDFKRAITEGLQFYRSVNNVILSSGNQQGFIEPKYFLRVSYSNKIGNKSIPS